MIAPDGFTAIEIMGARSPGWYEMECDWCGASTTGYEPTVDDWAWEHGREHDIDSGVACCMQMGECSCV